MPEPVMKPVEAGRLFLGSKDSRFRVFCIDCNGWAVWSEGAVECPACGRPNAEAYALNVGVREAKASLSTPTPTPV